MELPRLISVDDHVVEPAHVWERWLPERFRDRGPKIVRRGIREIDYVGTASYVEHFDDDVADQGRLLDLRGPRLHAQAHGRGGRVSEGGTDPHAHHLRRHAAGLLRPEGAPRRHGRELGRGVDVLPHPAAVLRADVPRRARQGSRTRVRAGLQRLDGRGVVRRLRRAPDPPCDHPPVGRRPRGRRGAAQRGPRRPRRLLQRAAVPPRSAHDPHRVLGPVLRRVRRHPHGRRDAHRLVVQDAGGISRRCRRR